MAEEIKLSEIYIDPIRPYVAKAYANGADWALDNIAPKIVIAFEEWKIEEGITWYNPFPGKSIPSYFRSTNHSMDCSSAKELFSIFLKQHKSEL